MLDSAGVVTFSCRCIGEYLGAAVRFGVASRKPVLFTPVNNFAGVSAAVSLLLGKTTDAIAAELIDFFTANDSGAGVAEDQERWLKETASSIVSKMFGESILGHIHDLLNQKHA